MRSRQRSEPRRPARRCLSAPPQQSARRPQPTRSKHSTSPRGRGEGREGGTEGRRGTSALDDALSLLAFRPHARRELELKLARRSHGPDEVAAALDRVAELGYIDDAAFARTLTGVREGRRGTRAIAAELRARGVDREAIEGALAGVDRDRELAAAVDFARRRLRGITTPADRRRAAAALVRRGYDYETARTAVARAAGEADDEPL